MAPVYDINVEDVEPMSRTYQYRKVMKPMLERKRRARINKCLDELKELMVCALQDEGESITKLEKADVLELTVTHLKKLKRVNALKIPAASHSQEKFNFGFRQCTNEVTKFVNSCQGVDIHVSGRLLSHLNGCLNQMERFNGIVHHQPSQNTPAPITVTIPTKMYTPPASPECCEENDIPVQPLQTSSPRPVTQQQILNTPIPQQHQAYLHQQQQHRAASSTFVHHQTDNRFPTPPSPPLSVGAPSPPMESSSSPPPMPLQRITDSSVWRPW